MNNHPSNFKKVYGPYKRKDGREHVVCVSSDGKKRTVSYPKYIMECHLNIIINEPETIDHIDRDFTNNSIDNLRIVERSKHASDDSRRVKDRYSNCTWCGVEIKLTRNQTLQRCVNQSGPFCSKSCASKSNSQTRINGKEVYGDRIIEEKIYYYKDKSV